MSENFSMSLDEIAAEITSIRILQPGETTVSRLMEKTGLPWHIIRRRLESRKDLVAVPHVYDPERGRFVTVYEKKKDG